MFKKYIDLHTLLEILSFKDFCERNDFLIKRKAKKLFACLIKQEFIIPREETSILFSM